MVQKTYYLVIIYYWTLINVVDYFHDYDGTGLKYYLITIPIIIFTILNSRVIMRNKYDWSTRLLVLYIGTTGLFSLARFDYAVAFNIFIWSMPVIILLNSNVKINYRLINLLYLAQILICIYSFYAGVNKYGYLPDQSQMNLHQGLNWRICLFPFSSPAYSGIFSLLVFLLNLAMNKKRTKWFFIIFSSYFLILSGSRTSILCLLSVFLFTLMSKFVVNFKQRDFYRVFPIIFISFLVLFIFFPFLFSGIIIENEFFQSFLLKSKDTNLSTKELSDALARATIWKQHFFIFIAKFPFGASSFRLSDYFQVRYTGSDAMLTLMMARDGILVLPFFIFLYSLFFRSVRKQNKFAYATAILVVVYFLVYGGFMHSRDFLFLIMIGMLNSEARGSVLFRVRHGATPKWLRLLLLPPSAKPVRSISIYKMTI